MFAADKAAIADDLTWPGVIGAPPTHRLTRGDLDLVVTVDAVDDIRDPPGGHEHADDHIAERAEIVVERTDRAPEPATLDEAQSIADQIERLEAAPDHRDEDRHGGNGEIVIELADWLDEGPAIGPKHEDAVGRIEQSHAGREQRGKDQDRPDREALRRLTGRDAQQAHLRRRVEAEAEQDSEGIHLPAALD